MATVGERELNQLRDHGIELNNIMADVIFNVRTGNFEKAIRASNRLLEASEQTQRFIQMLKLLLERQMSGRMHL